jgi:hypothetical protein
MVGFWKDLKTRKGRDVIGPNQMFPREDSDFTWHEEMSLKKEFSGVFLEYMHFFLDLFLFLFLFLLLFLFLCLFLFCMTIIIIIVITHFFCSSLFCSVLFSCLIILSYIKGGIEGDKSVNRVSVTPQSVSPIWSAVGDGKEGDGEGEHEEDRNVEGIEEGRGEKVKEKEVVKKGGKISEEKVLSDVSYSACFQGF